MELYSLFHVLHPPPLNKIIVEQQQIHLLLDKVNFFINFLENYPCSQRSEEIESVERRITNAAHEAEDIVESNVVDQIHAARERDMLDGEKFSALLSQSIQRVLEKFISIEEELPMMMVTQGVEGLQLKTVTASSRSLPGGKKITMVGFDHTHKTVKQIIFTHKKLQNIKQALTEKQRLLARTLAARFLEVACAVVYTRIRGENKSGLRRCFSEERPPRHQLSLRRLYQCRDDDVVAAVMCFKGMFVLGWAHRMEDGPNHKLLLNGMGMRMATSIPHPYTFL